jgi:phosphodiesterase/alkaline phosphatase D-like protein
MNKTTPTNAMSDEPTFLGPFLGHVTTGSIKIWLHLEGSYEIVYITVHAERVDAPQVATAILTLRAEKLFTDCATIAGLQPDTRYFYKLWTNDAFSDPLPLGELKDVELQFWTLPTNPNERIDFVVMSCHDPTVATADGYEGHGVWADLPQIIARNDRIRFALLVGDQVYADEHKDAILAESSDEKRLRYYLSIYRKYWSNIHYRRVMCSLPAVMMWDDHDITDGWGSEDDSFVGKSSEFKPEWKNLFDAAFKAFSLMQASRNPAILAANPRDGQDFCFKVGSSGFVFLDLRTNRNLMLRRLHTSAQLDRIRDWVEQNKEGIQTLFVISPVVFSHGSPVIDDLGVKLWPYVMLVIDTIASWGKWGRGLYDSFYKSLGDIKDDIRDSWGAKENAEQADRLLDFLFDIQNDSRHRLGVVVISGDIHTSGYSNIYSNYQRHAGRSTIIHITSSSVAYKPFNWILEAVYRFATKAVALGNQGAYSSQISHHFCSRSVAVLSLRPIDDQGNNLLKVKYYLEAFPEPQILLFDLTRVSHSENIKWHAQDKLSARKYAPTAYFDVDALIALRAKEVSEKLNPKESIVDMLKLFELDSSLDARKRLAKKWGYRGDVEASREMNIWLLAEMKARITERGGKIPEDIKRGQGLLTSVKK